ncbi:MAG: sulfatase-like hydrolase/transferase [Planctomycetota bacterium]|nr:sulfatase-like hydrolase/transferase [Planctomycetota bacterium]
MILILLTSAFFSQTPQNVVVILADDMGLASLYAEHPSSGLPTPHLDRLASQSMSFTDAHSGSAVCSPTRYGLLTGRYAWRTSMKQGIVPKWGPPLIAPERMTLANVAKAAGLETASIGKWHLGWHWPKKGGGFTRKPSEIDYTASLGGGPMEAGFDYSYGDDVPNWPPYIWIENNQALSIPTGTMQEDNANGVRAGPMRPGWSLEAVLPELTRKSVKFIQEQSAVHKPFFLYLPLTSPHTPINPAEEFQGKSGVSKYADFLLQTDWSVGQVLQALEDCGIAENTLVIFTGDNGTSPKADFESLAKGGVDLQGPWRGHKADVWEGGHRVPFLVRWPGVVEPGSKCAEPIGLTDVMATVAEALKIPLPSDAAEDSKSLMDLLQGKRLLNPLHKVLVNHSSLGEFAVRSGKWKLCFCPGSGGWSAPRGMKQAKALSLPPIQLYDMVVDPSEQNNLANQFPEVVTRLREEFFAEVHRVSLDSNSWWGKLPWTKDEAVVGIRPRPLKVVTYNVLEGFENHRVGSPYLPGEQRKKGVIKWLQKQSPDVIGWQELNGYTTTRLREESRQWGHEHAVLLKERGYDLGLSSVYPIEVVERVTKGMHHGFLHVRTAGIDFMVCHLWPFKGEQRLREIHPILKRAKEVLEAGRPLIILGDFNALSSEDSHLMNPIAMDWYKGWKWEMTKSGQPHTDVIQAVLDIGMRDTWAAHRPLSFSSFPDKPRVDYIFSSPNLMGSCSQSTWFETKSMHLLSDHAPLSAIFSSKL